MVCQPLLSGPGSLAYHGRIKGAVFSGAVNMGCRVCGEFKNNNAINYNLVCFHYHYVLEILTMSCKILLLPERRSHSPTPGTPLLGRQQ